MKLVYGVVFGLLATAAPAVAHHSFSAEFDTDNENIYQLRKLYELEKAKGK
jgi:hypothetical protein